MRKVGVKAVDLGSDFCRYISDPSKTVHLPHTAVLLLSAHAQSHVSACSALIGPFARHFADNETIFVVCAVVCSLRRWLREHRH